MPLQHTITALDALLAKVDAVLRGTGTDPADVSTDDKILLAVQYIEVSTVYRIISAHDHTEVRRL